MYLYFGEGFEQDNYKKDSGNPIGKQTIYGKVHRGEIPHYKVGNRPIFRKLIMMKMLTYCIN